jgi:cytochrome oxidase Cu insertion factor (SCO1/SenC/PrrC family)
MKRSGTHRVRALRSWPIVGNARGAVIAFLTLAFVAATAWWQLSQMFAARGYQPPAPIIALDRLTGLVDHRGLPLRDDRLDGRPIVAFFGYTRCPDVCPMELATIAKALDRLGAEADSVQAFFVSLDPEHDTQATLASYVTAFHPGITGLSGTPEAVAAAAEAFGVRHAQVDSGEGTYTIDHTALTFVIDGEGRLIEALPFASPTEKLLDALTPLIAGSAAAGRTGEGGGN